MIGRFRYEDKVFQGDVKDGIVVAKGDVKDSFELSELEILPPVTPSKIVCIGLNYRDHAAELNMEVPDGPIIFIKPASTVIGYGDSIVYPASSEQVDYEAELAIVIGKKCKNVGAENALDVIAGYTCLNDVTARDLQSLDGQWTRSKSFDTFAPIGPFIASTDELDPANARVMCRVNGEVRQDSSTSNLIFDVPYLIEFISGIMTLEEGDLIATGTPPGVGELHRDDVVEVEIENIGILKNEVV